jgi:hypothetical protein
MTVYSLLTINPKTECSCTLVLDSIRTGFPTANLSIWFNNMANGKDIAPYVEKLGTDDDKYWVTVCPVRWHHARWIEMIVRNHHRDGEEKEPCIIIDGDMIFWESVEDYVVQSEALYAGMYVPMIFNDFARVVSMPRIHTSFMWIPDTDKLLDKVTEMYPYSDQPHGNYCPLDPFGPRVSYINHFPIFWDTCSTLYNMAGGQHFDAQMLSKYEHLNSASFYDIMLERLDNKKGFEALHSHYVKNPDLLKGYNLDIVRPYYRMKHDQALKIIKEFDIKMP